MLTKNLQFYRKYCSYNIAKVIKSDENIGKTITIQGWVKAVRKMKENTFIDLSDGSCEQKLQIYLSSSEKPENLTPGASIRVNGLLDTNPGGQLELRSENIEVLGPCDTTQYPFKPRKTYNAEYVRQYLHLRPRTNNFSALLRVRNAASLAIHEHLNSQGFLNVHTPILTSNDCEGAGEVFAAVPDNKTALKRMAKANVVLDEAYFDSKVFLSVSGQLHLEAIAHGLSKVYTFGPTFRAENSKSRFHLSEFYMLEVEEAFVDNLEQVAASAEGLIKGVTKRILDTCQDDLNRINGDRLELDWANKNFPIMSYDEAIAMLKSKNVHVVNGFTKEDEILLVKLCGNLPVFIVNWPKNGKPFYMKECPENSEKVAALDLLGPNVGEIVGGSLREDDYERLKEKLPNDNMQWYLDLRRFGSVPTGGYGLGFERYLQMILDVNNIKDVIPFPRWPHNCDL